MYNLLSPQNYISSPLTGGTLFPSIANSKSFSNSRTHIPIRSISYKKNLSILQDDEPRKNVYEVKGQYALSPSYTVATQFTSPTRASTVQGSKPGTATAQQKMNMTCSLHKISLISSKFVPTKGAKKLTQKQLETQKSLYTNPSHHETIHRTKDSFSKDDYFKLLFDENRKPFKVEDYDGADEYYTPNQIMKRIHDHGFRDPEYYATRTEFTEMRIKDETEIRDEYRFKMPVLISSMENDNTLVAHVLGGTLNNIKFIESTIEAAQKEIKIIKAEKKQIEDETEKLKNKFETEIDNIQAEFVNKLKRLEIAIKEDFVANQNENFRFQKEIILLKREKLKVEKEIEACVPPMQRMEDGIYGRSMFNVEPNDAELNNIMNMNLRPEMQRSMKNKPLIH